MAEAKAVAVRATVAVVRAPCLNTSVRAAARGARLAANDFFFEVSSEAFVRNSHVWLGACQPPVARKLGKLLCRWRFHDCYCELICGRTRQVLSITLRSSRILRRRARRRVCERRAAAAGRQVPRLSRGPCLPAPGGLLRGFAGPRILSPTLLCRNYIIPNASPPRDGVVRGARAAAGL